MKNNKISLVGLIEIRIKESNVIKSMVKIVRGWSYVYNYNYVINGRIWVIWKFIKVDVIILVNYV